MGRSNLASGAAGTSPRSLRASTAIGAAAAAGVNLASSPGGTSPRFIRASTAIGIAAAAAGVSPRSSRVSGAPSTHPSSSLASLGQVSLDEEGAYEEEEEFTCVYIYIYIYIYI